MFAYSNLFCLASTQKNPEHIESTCCFGSIIRNEICNHKENFTNTYVIKVFTTIVKCNNNYCPFTLDECKTWIKEISKLIKIKKCSLSYNTCKNALYYWGLATKEPKKGFGASTNPFNDYEYQTGVEPLNIYKEGDILTIKLTITGTPEEHIFVLRHIRYLYEWPFTFWLKAALFHKKNFPKVSLFNLTDVAHATYPFKCEISHILYYPKRVFPLFTKKHYKQIIDAGEEAKTFISKWFPSIDITDVIIKSYNSQPKSFEKIPEYLENSSSDFKANYKIIKKLI